MLRIYSWFFTQRSLFTRIELGLDAFKVNASPAMPSFWSHVGSSFKSGMSRAGKGELHRKLGLLGLTLDPSSFPCEPEPYSFHLRHT